MPLIYGPTEMTNPQPKNFVTPSRTTGIYVQNVSPLALIITSGLGSIELPPWQTATLEMMPNDNMNVSAIPITAVPPALAAYAYVDISYTFQGVTVQGSGLFFPFMTPGGDAVAAGIMGPDGLQVGTSRSNPNNSSLLVQLTGSLAPLTAAAPTLLATYPYTVFAASTTYYPTVLMGVLHRNARARTFLTDNGLNQPLTTLRYGMRDSQVVDTSQTTVSAVQAPPASTVSVDPSSAVPQLAANVDSLALSVGMGATAPTSGQVKLYVVEAF